MNEQESIPSQQALTDDMSVVLDEDFRRKFELFEKWLRKNK